MDDIENLAPQFMALFAGLERAYGVYQIPKRQSDAKKVQGRALTESKPVTVELWQNHLSGKSGIGIIPIRDDGKVNWAVIDVDVYPLDLAALEKKLTDLMLPLVLCRSKSGGAHLFLFCKTPLPAKFVRNKLSEWAILIGYPGVEIFPKQSELSGPGDIGNWLNMPYMDCAADTRRAMYEGKLIPPEDFLVLAEGRKVTKEQLDKFIIGSEESFKDGPPCLENLIRAGFPRGTRNKGMFNLGVFARFAFGDDWQTRFDEFNRKYMEPPLSTSELMTIQKSLTRKTYFYTCSQEPIVGVCQKEICKTRKFGIGTNNPESPPVMIGGITKIMSEPPMYEVEVEGKTLECTAEDIINQNRFRLLVFQSCNKFVPLLKGPSWEALVNEKMKMLETQEAPPDAGPEGQFMAHLENFSNSRVTASELDEIVLGKPYVDVEKARVFFRSPDLIRYLESMHFREFTERQIWAVLKRVGGKHHQFMLKAKCVTAWSIPSTMKQSEDFKPARPEGSDI